ncbi:MAG: GNAT family N-acetyltransferase [Hyphomicrobiales bacterium]|nr:GNAT family N-acetyltransferase [Hyphomicrobiales bacterium]MCP4998866.1 GNAT family N-acetyltransferase [Hyphomicrobiales bacterium]
MTKSKTKKAEPFDVGPLTPEDLDAVVAIDQALTGASRHDFFKRRLAAALENPGDFVYVGLRIDNRLVGFALARLVDGEFGKPGASASLDAIGVDLAHQHKDIGHQLLTAIEEVLRHKGVTEFTSQVQWANQDLVGFFAHAGFELAPRIVLSCSTARPAL